MPQLDFFIFFDSALTAGLFFFGIHIVIVFYLLPIWLRGRVMGRVLFVRSSVGKLIWFLKKHYKKY